MPSRCPERLAAVTLILSCVACATGAAHFSDRLDDARSVLRIDVPGIGLEGPYLSDVNNGGPYLGDANNDGLPDLAVSPWSTTGGHTGDPIRHIVIFLNRGGRFEAAPNIRLRQDNIGNCLIGDFDGDGKADIASVLAGTFRIYLGGLDLSGHVDTNDGRTHPGGWTDVPYGLSGHGRLDLDGEPLTGVVCDFVGGARWRRLVSVDAAQEVSLGLFVAPDAEQWVSSDMADIDGDGRTDVIVLSKQSAGFTTGVDATVFAEDRIMVRVYYGPFRSMNVGPGEASRLTELALPGTRPEVPLALNAVADMNGDARPDLVLTSGQTTMLLLQTADGFSADALPAVPIGNADRRLAVADIDLDGLNDLVVCRPRRGDIAILRNRGRGVFARSVDDADETLAVPVARAIAVGDLNGDEWQDLAVLAEGSVIVFFNTKGQGDAAVAEEHEGTPKPGTAGRDADAAQFSMPALTAEARMMPYYTGTILPTPRHVVYRDTFLDLADVGVVVGDDVADAAPLVDVLVTRIRLHGGHAGIAGPDEPHAVWVSLGHTPLATRLKSLPELPDEPEAYVMASGPVEGKPVVVLKGRDRLGLLWAISSFNQLVHCRDGRAVLRVADVRDYPVAQQRGELHAGMFHGGGHPAKSVLYNIAFKQNMVVYKHLAFSYLPIEHPVMSWRDMANQAAFQRRCIQEIGRGLTPLGIEWYGGMHPAYAPCEYKLSGAKEDLDILMRYADMIAAAGGHFYIQLDDHRFWLNPYDEKAFGTARRADVHILNSLLGRLRDKYPNARMMCCPPFYWGPKGGVAKWYGEPRETYLRFMGENLSDFVSLQWTGARVKSPGASREHVRWITDMLRREPSFWQNWATDRHTTDPITAWPDWLYDGFFRDVTGYFFNCPDVVLQATIADYCWNPSAYDPVRSVREAVGKLLGGDAFAELREADDLLASLNRFWPYVYACANGRYESCPAAAKEIDVLERRVTEAQQIYRDVREGSPGGAHWMPVTKEGYYAGFVRQIKRDDTLEAHLTAPRQRVRAREETSYEPERHAFLAACDFQDAFVQQIATPEGGRRMASVLSGHKPAVSASFVVPSGAGDKGAWQLVFSGVTGGSTHAADDPLGDFDVADAEIELDAEPSRHEAKPVSIVIACNGQTVYEGVSPFGMAEWSAQAFPLAANVLAEENVVTIRITSARDALSTEPLLCINYGVVRPTAGSPLAVRPASHTRNP